MRERRESSDDEDLDRAVSTCPANIDMQQLMSIVAVDKSAFLQVAFRSARQSSCADPSTILCQS